MSIIDFAICADKKANHWNTIMDAKQDNSQEKVIPEKPDIKQVILSASSVKPHTYFHELAEAGLLIEFLETYMPEKFSGDQKFRESMLRVAMDKSPFIDADLGMEILTELLRSLNYFTEQIHQHGPLTTIR
jgi:hypothetical protein